MTPAARVQTAIELLDAITAAARSSGPPADRLLAEWFRANRFAGSKDRRELRELVYRAIRICGPIPQSGRAAMLLLAQDDPALLLHFDGSRYGPPPVEEGELIAEGGIAPHWLMSRLAASDIAGPEAEALLDRAPLDLRVRAPDANRDELAQELGAELLPAPYGLRLPPGTPVERCAPYRSGRVEVQDCGSQLACEAVEARPGETIIDLCAGAGGKTLALAAAMANQGTLIAADTDRRRLSQIPLRAERTGAHISEIVLLDPGRETAELAGLEIAADAVLVDAPCSGTGTWRRNPEARWRLDPAALERFALLQQRLLGIAARLVKPGGRLIFVTCSLLDEEGAEQASAFLAEHRGWFAESPALPLGRPRGAGWRLTPAHDKTDGFFIARFRSP